MKKTFVHLTAVLVLFLVVQTGNCQTANGPCMAFIDNKGFDLNDLKPVTANIAEPTLVTEVSAKTAVNIAVAGKGGDAIKFSLGLTEPLSPGSVASNVSLCYNGATYTMMKGDSNIEVTDFIWSRDRKSFMISVNFNCTMHSTVFPEDGKRTVNLKGKVLRVKVMVPGAASASN